MGAEDAPHSRFRSRAAELDRAEGVAENADGGPTDEMLARVRNAEFVLQSSKPNSLADYRWLTGRLARAIENGWTRDAAAFLLRLAM